MKPWNMEAWNDSFILPPCIFSSRLYSLDLFQKMSLESVLGSIDLKFDNKFATLTINRGQNRINDDFIEKMNMALDQIEA